MTKHDTITSLRWGALPYTAGSGLHVGCGLGPRTFPNAIGIEAARGPAVDLQMRMEFLPRFADGLDFVVAGDILQRVTKPRELLAECWRALRVGGNLVLERPTPIAYEWLLADAADYCVMANLRRGEMRVDVVQKLGPGDGAHRVPEVKAEKTVGLVRAGGLGDAIWATAVCQALKAEGYHVTAYVEEQGEQILRHDPAVDRIIVTDELRMPGDSQMSFWCHEQARYDRWINLIESVEKNLLAVPGDLRFYWPAEERRRIFGHNYLEAVHRLAGTSRRYQQRFVATPEERSAAALRQVPGRKSAVFAVSGSTLPKFWPYVSDLCDGLIARGYDVWVLGEMRGLALAPRAGLHVVGRGWGIREALAFAQLADLVAGQETGILNAVANEPMRKVVLLSHSTAKNLTRDWSNTVALHGDAECWPCHRIHYLQNGWQMCNQDEATRLAKCQATISVDQVLEAVDRRFVVKAVA